jgi:hypothetical protein
MYVNNPEEKKWAGDVQDKTSFLKDEDDEKDIIEVIEKLKSDQLFDESDTKVLSTFTKRINKILLLNDRLNNFKEGKALENGEKLRLYELFNTLKSVDKYDDLTINLNKNLNKHLQHLFSVIKHSQKPDEYPVYFPLHRNIMREILEKSDDYDLTCEFYRTFPKPERHFNFAIYFKAIANTIAKDKKVIEFVKNKGSKEYNYVTKNYIPLPQSIEILDSQLGE